MNENQAKTVIHEIEEILRGHGVWYSKIIEYKDRIAYIRLEGISIKIDSPDR